MRPNEANSARQGLSALKRLSEAFSFLAIGTSEADLDDHIIHQMTSDYSNRRWIYAGQQNDRYRIVVSRDADLVEQLRADMARNRIACAALSSFDLPYVIRQAAELTFVSGPDGSRLPFEIAAHIDAYLLLNRLEETGLRLSRAASAATACQLLNLRDQLVGGDVDLAIAHEWDLSSMPWFVNVSIEVMDISALHFDGNAISFLDEWIPVGLGEVLDTLANLGIEMQSGRPDIMEQAAAVKRSFSTE